MTHKHFTRNCKRCMELMIACGKQESHPLVKMMQVVPPTRVIDIRSAEQYQVYIGRPSRFGNPYTFKKSKLAKEIVDKPEDALDKFREYFYEKVEKDETFRKAVLALRGKTLGCFCVKGLWSTRDGGPVVCHGQVIAEYVDKK